MIHAGKNTVFSLLSRDEIGVRTQPDKYFPAMSLKMSCEVVHRQNGHPCRILRVVGGVDSRDTQNQHVRFTLCGLRKSFHDMLERARLARLFEIRPTVEEPLSAVGRA